MAAEPGFARREPTPARGEKRYLILAEGHSGDAHYGKTMRGVVAYSPHPTVAILDSERVGESYEGIPVVGTVDEALPLEPTTALVGVATQGGRFPPAWRDLLKASIEAGLDVENGLHEFITDDPELTELAAQHGVELRDLRKPPADLSVPTGANLELAAKTVLTVGSDCAIGKKTVAIELDREAQRRGLRSGLRPHRPDGDRDRGLGHRRRRRRRGLPRGRGRAARRRRGAAWGRAALRRGQGSLVHPAYSGVTLGLMHGSAPHAYVLCHVAGATAIEGYPHHPIPPLSELVELHERVVAAAAAREGRGDRPEHA